MSAYTASANGEWEHEPTWGQTLGSGLYPKSGDTATIPVGISVTIADGHNETVGTSGVAGTAALTIAKGSLTIGGGTSGSLTLQGDCLVQGSAASFPTTPQLVMSAGSTITFLCPASTQYKIDCSPVSGGFYSTMACNGTSSAHCTITSNLVNGATSTGWIHTNGTSNYQGLMLATYTDFSNLNDQINTTSSQGGIQSVATTSTSGSGFSGSNVSFSNCTYNNCGKHLVNLNGNNAGVFSYTNNLWGGTTTNPGSPVSGPAVNIGLDLRTNSAVTTGSRTLSGNTFDIQVNMAAANSLTINGGNVFGGAINQSTSAWGTWDSNTYVNVTAGPQALAGSCTNSLVLGSGLGNPKSVSPFNTAGSYTIAGNVFASLMPTDGNGDCINNGSTVASNNTIYNNIVLADPGKRAVGVLYTGGITAGSGSTNSIYGNTNFVGLSQFGSDLGETQPGFTGAIPVFGGNLAWADVANSPIMLNEETAAGGAQDYVSAGNADYNGNVNLKLSSGGSQSTTVNSYSLNLSSGTPGSHDQTNVDPQFVDSTRSFERWAGDYMVANGHYTPASNRGAWASGRSYTAGDVVQCSTPHMSWGKTIWYRCNVTHTSSNSAYNTQQPGLIALQNLHFGGPASGSVTLELIQYNGSVANTTSLANTSSASAIQSALNTALATFSGHTYTATCSGGPLNSADVLVQIQDSGVDTNDIQIIWQTISFPAANKSPYAQTSLGVTIPSAAAWQVPTWEPLSWYILRTSSGANTITDGSLDLSGATYTQAATAWVSAGFRPKNVAYKGASYPTKDARTADRNGTAFTGTPDIGAMAVLPSAVARRTPSGDNVRIGTRAMQVA